MNMLDEVQKRIMILKVREQVESALTSIIGNNAHLRRNKMAVKPWKFRKTCPVCFEEFNIPEIGVIEIVCEECKGKISKEHMNALDNAIKEAHRDCVQADLRKEEEMSSHELPPPNPTLLPDDGLFLNPRFDSDRDPESIEEMILRGVHEDLED